MNFILDNWLWFLIAAIILLMTLIGYVAEQTDFGRKEIEKKEKPKKEKKKKEKPKKEKNKKEEPEVLIVEESENKPEVQISLATDSILNNELEVDESFEEEIPEELNVPFGDVRFEEPIEVMTDVLENKDINEELVQENTIEDTVVDEPVVESNLDEIAIPDMELPDLDAIVSEDNDDDDDVWKF